MYDLRFVIAGYYIIFLKRSFYFKIYCYIFIFEERLYNLHLSYFGNSFSLSINRSVFSSQPLKACDWRFINSFLYSSYADV